MPNMGMNSILAPMFWTAQYLTAHVGACLPDKDKDIHYRVHLGRAHLRGTTRTDMKTDYHAQRVLETHTEEMLQSDREKLHECKKVRIASRQ